jgi:hypothetical protein
MSENVLFWMDLSAANLGGNNIPSTSTFWGYNPNCSNSINATGTQIPLPRGKLGYSTFVHVYETRGRNWFQLANITSFSSGTSTVNGAVTIPVLQAYSLDKKVDDGIPDKGNVTAVYIVGQNVTTTAPNAAADSATTCYNTATTPSAYSITYNNGAGTNCALSFRFQ